MSATPFDPNATTGSEQPTLPPLPPNAPQSRVPFGEKPGDFIGPYRLLELIGEGGFGTVWLAERREPMVQRVAIKVIKPGMDTRQVVARFEQERQALAVMDHPNVARVLDGGVTPTGRPFFIMELVKGEPISEFADQHRLTIRQRLELFIPVCDAVQHAHIKGIIHRDLKPSNVLVAMIEDTPVVKVIDFGIAKATDASDVQNSVFSMEGQIIGTPEYMSPEQAGGRLDIDTRTDVYSLGVMLYELLVGRVPFDPETLRKRGMDEIRRIIREEIPPRPSTRLSSVGAEGVAVARTRHHSPASLIRELRRELEWIPLKAMRKERERRYDSAAAFAEDIRRYLDGRALRAAPESRAYLARKFVSRNRVLVTASVAVLVALSAGLAGTIWQAREAAWERDQTELARKKEATQRARADERADAATRAEAAATVARDAEKQRADQLKKVSDFQASMLSQIDTTKAGVDLMGDVRERFAAALENSGVSPAERTARVDALQQELARVNATDTAAAMIDRTILKPAIRAIDEEFKEDPKTDAGLRQTLADLYESIGLYDAALPLQESALATRRRVLGEEHPDTITSIGNLGLLLQDQGKLGEAEPYDRDALEKSRRVLGEEHPQTLASIDNLGGLLQAQGRLAEAEPYWREALEKSRRVLGEQDPRTIVCLSNLGTLFQAQHKLEEAEPYLREALEKRRRVLGQEHPSTIGSINNLATLLDDQGKFSEAEACYREAIEKSRRVLGEEHPSTLLAINNLGVMLWARGRLVEAEPCFREAMEKRRRVLGEEHPETLMSMNNMGALLRAQGRPAEAEPYYREALGSLRRLLGNEHPMTLQTIDNLGVCLSAQNKLDEAEPYYQEALEKRRRVLGEDHPDTLRSVNNLASLLEACGRYREALDLLAPIEPIARKSLKGGDAPRFHTFLTWLARARIRLGFDAERFKLAESNLREVLPTSEGAQGESPGETRGALEAFVELYAAWDKAEPGKGYDAKANEWQVRLDAARAQATPAEQGATEKK